MEQQQQRGKFRKKYKAAPKISGRAVLDAEIERLKTAYESLESLDTDTIRRFSDFPLSEKTLKGLTESKYIQPTPVQRLSLGSALQGKDILGAAITGSGKTLAFLIPVREWYYHTHNDNDDDDNKLVFF